MNALAVAVAVAVVADSLVKTCKLIGWNYDLWPAAITQQVTLKEATRGRERESERGERASDRQASSQMSEGRRA